MTRTALASSLVLAVFGGCIIPDRGIDIEPLDDNQFAVRIVQATPLLGEMFAVCSDEEADNQELARAHCPQVPVSLPSGLVRPAAGGFCTCPGNARDGNAIKSDEFVIWAEDADRDGGEAKDTLYGVALLDPDPALPFSDAWSYANYWDPALPGTRMELTEIDPDLEPSIGRVDNGLWQFQLQEPGSDLVDLCNDAEPAPGKLAIGVHTLRFLVTDRPFFQVEDPPRTQYGVPDLAAGASYALIDYVFECVDPAVDPTACNCVEVGQ